MRQTTPVRFVLLPAIVIVAATSFSAEPLPSSGEAIQPKSPDLYDFAKPMMEVGRSSFLERLPNFVDLGSFALLSEGYSPTIDPRARLVPTSDKVFKSDPSYPQAYNAADQIYIYGGKHAVNTTRPLLEMGRELYYYGPFQPGINVVGTDLELGRTGFHAFAVTDNAVTGGIVQATVFNGVPTLAPTGYTFVPGGLNSGGCDGSGNFVCFSNSASPPGAFTTAIGPAMAMIWSRRSGSMGG
jgi:hypothetical protein